MVINKLGKHVVKVKYDNETTRTYHGIIATGEDEIIGWLKRTRGIFSKVKNIHVEKEKMERN